MTAATTMRPATEAEARLRVWRERWQHAPTADARAHAQLAIDLWLDRLLDVPSDDHDLSVPAQYTVIDLRSPVTV